jgi:hypothetical protein
LLPVGCFSLENWVVAKKPPCGQVCQVAATWESQVFFTPDPVHGGKPSPVLGGRVYLFDQHYQSVACTGDMMVQLYVEGPPDKGGQPVLLEQWNYPQQVLQTLCSKDMIGWGYTLALPWATFNPAISKVEIAVCYTTAGGVPQYSRTKLKLQHGERPFRMTENLQTGSGQVIPTPPASGPVLPAPPGTAGPVLPAPAATPGPVLPTPPAPVGPVLPTPMAAPPASR